MTDQLRKKNPDIEFIDINSPEFREYGEVISDFDASELIEAAKRIENPSDGAKYIASERSLESLPSSLDAMKRFFGGLPAQIGYCFGYNDSLNATEWHSSSEINIAATDLCLILAKRNEIINGNIDSSKFKAFFIPKGTTVEIYDTTLHFTPCHLSEKGFGCIVILPYGTNTPLEERKENSVLWSKNKWLLSHFDNAALLDKGAVGGITGENIRIKF